MPVDINISVDELIEVERHAIDLAAEIKDARSRLSAGGKKITAKEWLRIVGKAGKLLSTLVGALT